MSCTFTDRDFYSEYINTELRGDGGVLGVMYQPVKNGVKLKGGDIWVTVWDTDNMTTAAPLCSAFPGNTGKCNRTVELTMAVRMIDSCFKDCEWLDINSDQSSLMRMIEAHVSVLTGYFLDLIYADMIANGTAISSAATATGATLVAGINEALAEIWARGGGDNCAIILNADMFALFSATAGASFSRIESINQVDRTGGAFRGLYQGAQVYLTPTNLATAETTPVEVGAIIFDRMGYAWATDGEGLGARIVFNPDDPRGVVSTQVRTCAGYGLLEDELVYYLDLDT